MERTFSVTINLDKNGEAEFIFIDDDSGDSVSYCTTVGAEDNSALYVGKELMSWLSLMADELEDCDDEEN